MNIFLRSPARQRGSNKYNLEFIVHSEQDYKDKQRESWRRPSSIWDTAAPVKSVTSGLCDDTGQLQEQSTALLVITLTIIWKNGCCSASLMVIRFFGSTISSLQMRSFGGSANNI